MKLSISWIFDHINADWKKYEIGDLVKKFNQITAETEHFKKVVFDVENFILVKAIESKGLFEFYNTENNKLIKLIERGDLVNDGIYLVAKENKTYRWATLKDLNSEKEGFLTNVCFSDPEDLKGGWRKSVETEDYILTVDNKSITNRPDMWGHRGFAREIAAILNLPLWQEERFLINQPIKHYDNKSPESSDNPFSLEIKDSDSCKRLAGVYINKIENRPSSLFIAHRLARIDSKPIDFIVDLTNYVMFDISQPMHAFDAQKIQTKKIIAEFAKDGQKLDLLDNTQITLSSKDLIISDGNKPISLAGIMGGADTAVTETTTSLFLESANFEASTIRQSSLRLKKRTESSARFEKTLDPNQNTTAIIRFLRLLEDYKIDYKAGQNIVSVGKLAEEKIITISHDMINLKIGVPINQDLILNILGKLGFGVKVSKDRSYEVTVPTFRSCKDVTIKEDVLEEISRFYGYTNIAQRLPERVMGMFDLSKVTNTRKVKNFFANTVSMHEVYTYALYDEDFLRQINFDPDNTINLINPISENNKRLTSSLIPNLFKAVANISLNLSGGRFFELNKIWLKIDNKSQENLKLSGIIADRKKLVDFYESKVELQIFFKSMSIDVIFKKPDFKPDIWFDPHQTAAIYHGKVLVGIAGKILSSFSSKFFDGDIFVFDLNGDFILNYKPEIKKFVPLSKYPEVDLDVSMLIGQDIEVEKIQDIIKSADSKIKSVELVDHFYKSEWKDLKSITMRFVIYDDTKTLTKSEIDEVYESVISDLQQLGAAIR